MNTAYIVRLHLLYRYHDKYRITLPSITYQTILSFVCVVARAKCTKTPAKLLELAQPNHRLSSYDLLMAFQLQVRATMALDLHVSEPLT